MKKIINKISAVIQVILMAPVKLPSKVLNIIKYIGLGLGIIESVIVENDDKEKIDEPPEAGVHGRIIAENSNADPDVSRTIKSEESTSDLGKLPDRLVKYHLETGEEVIDEIE